MKFLGFDIGEFIDDTGDFFSEDIGKTFGEDIPNQVMGVEKPKVVAPPPDPYTDPTLVAQRAQAARDERRRRAASSTILNSGGLGAISPDSLARRTLLGS